MDVLAAIVTTANKNSPPRLRAAHFYVFWLRKFHAAHNVGRKRAIFLGETMSSMASVYRYGVSVVCGIVVGVTAVVGVAPLLSLIVSVTRIVLFVAGVVAVGGVASAAINFCFHSWCNSGRHQPPMPPIKHVGRKVAARVRRTSGADKAGSPTADANDDPPRCDGVPCCQARARSTATPARQPLAGLRGSGMSTCVVTGANGFVGSHMVLTAARHFDKVIALDLVLPQLYLDAVDDHLHDHNGGPFAGEVFTPQPPPVQPAQGDPTHSSRIATMAVDITDEAALARVFAGVDTVYHLAAVVELRSTPVHWRVMHRVNALGTAAVVNACLTAGVRRMVYLSSSTTVQGPGMPATPTTEEQYAAMNIRPITLYGRTKLAGERYALAANGAIGPAGACSARGQ